MKPQCLCVTDMFAGLKKPYLEYILDDTVVDGPLVKL